MEPQLHPKRTGHNGRDSGCGGQRTFLRRGGCNPRCGVKPYVGGRCVAHDGGAHQPRFGWLAGRKGGSFSSHAARRSSRRRVRPVPRLSKRERRRSAFTGSNFFGHEALHRHMAMGGRSILHSRRKTIACHRDRGISSTQATPAGRVRFSHPRRDIIAAGASVGIPCKPSSIQPP